MSSYTVKLKKLNSNDKPFAHLGFILIIVVILLIFIFTLRYLVSLMLKEESSLNLAGIKYTLKMKKPVYKMGESIELNLILKNLTSKSVTLKFNQSPEYDFIVQKEVNWGILNLPMAVWKYSSHIAIKPNKHSRTLKPNQTLTFKAKWDQKNSSNKLVSPGRYIITGIIIAEKATTELQIRGKTKK